jgi:hypothetical protein
LACYRNTNKWKKVLTGKPENVLLCLSVRAVNETSNWPRGQSRVTREKAKMTITKYANGTTVKNSSTADALEDLRNEFPDMVSHNDGARILIWASESDAQNDDGKNAVAQLTLA